MFPLRKQRTAIYLASWIVLGVCWIFGYRGGFLLFVGPFSWAFDWLLSRRATDQPFSGALKLCRILNVIPVLPVLLIMIFWGTQIWPVIADHNDPNVAEQIQQMLGPSVPGLETWSASNRTFTGSGARFIRMRFPRASLSAIKNALDNNCVRSNGIPFSLEPEAWFLHWDPPPQPIAAYRCGSFVVEFGQADNSLLFYKPGH